jgi:hypothetical protein
MYPVANRTYASIRARGKHRSDSVISAGPTLPDAPFNVLKMLVSRKAVDYTSRTFIPRSLYTAAHLV